MSLENIVKYFSKRDLSGDEIQRLIGKPPVMYSDLPKYKTLEQLLGKERYCIILYQTSSKTNGHFVAITAYDNGTVSYRESYGYNPIQVKELCAYDDAMPRYIVELLAPYEVEYNRFDFQQKGKGISTCGRWSSIFCRMRNVPLRDLVRMVSTNKSEFLSDYDNIATVMTLLSLNDISLFEEGAPSIGQRS
jgi:hypothetical protein